ncbi:nucleotide exchange factor GrpE [Balneolales bacterium ANBcel1]|nr:nucleotide exchange factor GrpE [Balneolales bacterium ANBcel1]
MKDQQSNSNSAGEAENGAAKVREENMETNREAGDQTHAESADEQAAGSETTVDADALQAEMEQLKKELASSRESVLRKAAEFENLKRRTQKEKAVMFEDARVDAVSRFLPIREDLKRSLEAAERQQVDSGFVEGLKMMMNNFDRVLEQYNVEPIEETGVPFDVDRHDAMLSQPAGDDSVETNTVLQVMEPGYRIGDRVIRHAKVIVSQ